MDIARRWEKAGLIYKPHNEASWWVSNAMAPTAILLNENIIRVFLGCWDKDGISRIGYIDLNAANPSEIVKISNEFVLDIGHPGCFDDNGVFPGHAYKYNNIIYLYYTGFQKLDKIPFSNFGGLAISIDGGETFSRVSKAPVMDRADEGLFTRAGTSVICENGVFKSCYSAGSSWQNVANKVRPVYEVYYIESENGIDFKNKGNCIINCDFNLEHGLGRPQITKLNNAYYVFYTRRMLDFKYFIGVAKSTDLVSWVRIDNWFNNIRFGKQNEFDSEMIYFPSVIDTGNNIYLFYSGNGYGKDGLGYLKII